MKLSRRDKLTLVFGSNLAKFDLTPAHAVAELRAFKEWRDGAREFKPRLVMLADELGVEPEVVARAVVRAYDDYIESVAKPLRDAMDVREA